MCFPLPETYDGWCAREHPFSVTTGGDPMSCFRRLMFAVLLAVALIGPGLAGRALGSGPTTYEVTITNLTSGQPLTPPVLATHRRPVHLFHVGSPSPFELKE